MRLGGAIDNKTGGENKSQILANSGAISRKCHLLLIEFKLVGIYLFSFGVAIIAVDHVLVFKSSLNPGYCVCVYKLFNPGTVLEMGNFSLLLN